MEILRFDDAESSSARRKKSSRGMIVVGLVATLFGVGTAFASTTITINTGDTVNVGQGVSKVAACDNSITIAPVYSLNVDSEDGEGRKTTNGKPSFGLGKIVFSNVNQDTFTASSGDPNGAEGCGLETFEVQIFKNPGASSNYVSYSCGELGYLSDSSLKVLTDITGSADVSNAVKCDKSIISFQVPKHVGEKSGSFSFPIKITGSTQDIGYFAVTSRPTTTTS